ncbi:MAG: SRPBCC family protein [Acidimicrobiia bacterium]
MPACSYEVTAQSTAAPELVFELLADATSWPQWAGSLTTHGSWEREGTPPPGGLGAIRKLGRWPIYGQEEIVAYTPPTHLGYTILKGQPVRNYRADVTLTRASDGTLITWTATFDPRIPGTGKLVTAFFRRIITTFANGLADYAATK